MGKQINNANREKATTWAYVGWLVFGGFISLGVIFFWTVILIVSLFGVNMATQSMKLANYLFAGADEHIEPNYEAAKTQNLIWAILVGWFLFIFHKGMYYICKFFRCYNVAGMWNDTAGIVLHPFGVEIE